MARYYELYSSTTREERRYGYGEVYLINCKAPAVASEPRTIIEDCRSVVYNAGSNHMPQQDDDDYYNGWSTMKSAATACPGRAPVPPSVPVVMKKQKILTSDEAAKLYKGFVITEFGSRKSQRPWA